MAPGPGHDGPQARDNQTSRENQATRENQAARDNQAARENQSVRKAAALLRAAAAHGGGATVSALARDAGLPRATALRMVESLVAERLLARLPDDRVVIGAGLHALARSTNLVEILLDAARGVIEPLAEAVRESVTLTVLLPDGSLEVVRQVDGPHLLGLTNWVGRPFELHASSAGKLALAYASPDRVDALLRTPLTKVAPATITDPVVLRAELDRIRREGFSEIEDELDEGLAAISVGLFTDGVLVGSLNISGPTRRFGRAARVAALPLLRASCAAIERHLGDGSVR